ncbi:MAG: hypothetical protein ABIB71_01330 [Candidatus Woesearchaeota archaeon]
MRLILILVLAAVMIPFASASELLYSIKLDTSDNLELLEVKLVEGEMPYQLSDYVENYEAKAVSFKGEELQVVNLTISDFAYDAGEPVKASVKYLLLRYFANGKSVTLYNTEGNELLEIDVSQFSRCNEDEVCDFNENVKSCALDCTEEEVREREVEASFGEETPAAEEEAGTNRGGLKAGPYWPYILALALALAIALAFIIQARKK